MSPRDRKALLVGGSVVALSWLSLRAAPAAVLEIRRAEAELAQRADLVVRARERVDALGPLADSIAALESVAEALPKLLLAGGDLETASVDLMRRVGEIVERHARFESFDERAAGIRSGPLQMLTLRVRVETDLTGLVGFLEDVAGDSALSVEALQVSIRDPHAPAQRIERLTAMLRIGGWYLADEAGFDGGERR